jgi:dnd system-associated protein 4
VDNGVFETKQAAMMFAAALGKRFTGRKPRGAPGDGIRWYIFEKAGDEAFVNSLALAEKNDIKVLDPDVGEGEDVQAIFEEYAAGGFQYLKQHVVDSPGDLLENALAIVQQFQMSQQPAAVDSGWSASYQRPGYLSPGRQSDSGRSAPQRDDQLLQRAARRAALRPGYHLG